MPRSILKNTQEIVSTKISFFLQADLLKPVWTHPICAWVCPRFSIPERPLWLCKLRNERWAAAECISMNVSSHTNRQAWTVNDFLRATICESFHETYDWNNHRDEERPKCQRSKVIAQCTTKWRRQLEVMILPLDAWQSFQIDYHILVRRIDQACAKYKYCSPCFLI